MRQSQLEISLFPCRITLLTIAAADPYFLGQSVRPSNLSLQEARIRGGRGMCWLVGMIQKGPVCLRTLPERTGLPYMAIPCKIEFLPCVYACVLHDLLCNICFLSFVRFTGTDFAIHPRSTITMLRANAGLFPLSYHLSNKGDARELLCSWVEDSHWQLGHFLEYNIVSFPVIC
mmetsp:Transcript_630/g.4250  ORF Transcript_630/g.4250 Transcript_630/m.4250 type:complete len:174 (+) Transcript_630:7173-7694(+)